MAHSDILSRLPHCCSLATRWSSDSSSLHLLMQATFPLLLALLSVASAQAPAPIIDVGNARYQGSVNAATNISSYLGIRYAAAPIGDLRFRAPQNPPTLDGIQQATAEPQQCLQAGSGNSPTNPNPTTSLRSRATQDPEDCLFLNVFFPGSTVPTRPLPVVFWIHGGGYVAGGAGSFNGGDLVRESKNGVVTVIIQYRLGIFGFLSSSQVKANGALNAGLLDQEFALKWVQQHISKFGGDPDRVTIWGESAGAGSVLQHVVARDGMTSPPLFRAAMSSSSFLPSQHPFDGSVPESIFGQVVSQTGCGASSDTLSCLRAANVSILQAANVNVNRAGFFGTFVAVPVVDGEFITQRPTQA
ncbi:Carboxylic ester hydrolase, partial [Pleurotus pulmonarius]